MAQVWLRAKGWEKNGAFNGSVITEKLNIDVRQDLKKKKAECAQALF